MNQRTLPIVLLLLSSLGLATASVGCASRPLEAIADVPEAPTPIHYTREKRADTPQVPSLPIIPRFVIEAVQAEGPGRLLQRVPVMPFRSQGKFIGYQIVDLFPGENIQTNHIQPGDVIVRVNGRRVDRPEQFMRLFQDLHTWDRVEIELLRGEIRKTVVFLIQ